VFEWEWSSYFLIWAATKLKLKLKLLPLGGPLGSGKQWMSWIHREDLVELIIESLRNPQYSGVYNATAPNPVRMSELCSALGG
jgi:NAD dependent epimerase/dehydratase family enzyme